MSWGVQGGLGGCSPPVLTAADPQARHALRDVHPQGRAGGPAAVPEGEQGLPGVLGGWGPLPRVLTPSPSPHSKPSMRSGESFAR